MPPRRQGTTPRLPSYRYSKYSKRRSGIPGPLRLLFVLAVAALIAAVAIGSCGAGKKKNQNQAAGASTRPTVGILVGSPRPSAGGVGGPAVRATGTPGPGFVVSPPTPVPTCAPSDLLRQVDKQTALPADYAPSDLVQLQPKDSSPNVVIPVRLRREAEDGLRRMLEQARSANIFLLAQSGYRSYEDQTRIFQAEVNNFGEKQAERESARPGHSEHQLGLAVDFTTRALGFDLTESFAATAEARWLQQNAASFGFVLSYPQGREAVTGYMYEPWHYRYLGASAPTILASGQILNQWLAVRQRGCGA